MSDNKMIYNVKDKPKKWYEWIIYPLQLVLAVFVATVLIANLCGVPISTTLIGACIGTLIYQVITGFKSPMFISSCGATVMAVIGALLLGNTEGLTIDAFQKLPYLEKLNVPHNYLAVLIGGIIILLVYAVFAAIIKFGGKKYFDKIFPPMIVGAVTIVIGLNLAGFIPGYLSNSKGVIETVPVLVALFTMLVTAIATHYGKGFMKTIGFLIGLICGYILALILEVSGAYPSVYENDILIKGFGIIQTLTNIKWFNPYEFAFMNFNNELFQWDQIWDILMFFLPVAICAALEHYSDHKVLSNIIGNDLTEDPGLDRTLLGDGVASAVGTLTCGLPNTSYGESIATIGFSRVASVWMTTIAALIIGVMAFIAPVTAFVNSIPSSVFAGCSMILYGYIAASGLKTIMNNKVDLEDNKNLIVVSVILTVGVSGIFLFSQSFKGVSLAMTLGVILNLILHKKSDKLKD